MQDEQKQAPYLVVSQLVINSMEKGEECTGEINNNYLFWQITSVYRAICAHCSSPASLTQEPSSALGSSWALHQPACAWEVCPACLSPALQPTTLQVDAQGLF